jgi:transcriptional regulator with XRE-family HTH domain
VKDEDPQEIIELLALRICELRTQARLTQAQVAERLETTLTNYQRIEHGMQNLTVKTMVRIANAIGVKTSELFVSPTVKGRRIKGRPKNVN